METVVYLWRSASAFTPFVVKRMHDNSLYLFDSGGVVPSGPFLMKEMIEKRDRKKVRLYSDFPFGGIFRTALVSDRARLSLGGRLRGDFHPVVIEGVDLKYWIFRCGVVANSIDPSSSFEPLRERYQFSAEKIPSGIVFCEVVDGRYRMFFGDAFLKEVRALGLTGLDERVVWSSDFGGFAGSFVDGEYVYARERPSCHDDKDRR